MSAQGKASSVFSWKKPLLISLGVVGLLGVSALVILWPRTSCDGIFEQTAPRLEAHLEFIKNKGEFIVGRDQIQELSESAQKVGLHLKTCCAVLNGGKLDPQQFQRCIDKASAYDQHVDLIVQQLTKAVEAKEKGASTALQENIAGINQAIETAARDAEEFARQVHEIRPPKPEPNGEPEPRRVLARAEAQIADARVEVHELKRDNGAVTLKFAMINESDTSFGDACDFRETALLSECGRISGVYLFDAAEKKRYSVVRDASGKCICGEIGKLPPKSRATLWAKFPAPPENVRKITVVVPHFIPMDNVPISR